MPLPVGMFGCRFAGRARTNATVRSPMYFPDVPTVDRDASTGGSESPLARAAGRLGFSRTATDWRNAITEGDVSYDLDPDDLHDELSIAVPEASDARGERLSVR